MKNSWPNIEMDGYLNKFSENLSFSYPFHEELKDGIVFADEAIVPKQPIRAYRQDGGRVLLIGRGMFFPLTLFSSQRRTSTISPFICKFLHGH